MPAAASTDPDGDELSFKWYYYPEPGTFNCSTGRSGSPLKIENADKAEASFIVPKAGRLGTMHIIVEVSDGGKPSLTRYQRVIINVTE